MVGVVIPDDEKTHPQPLPTEGGEENITGQSLVPVQTMTHLLMFKSLGGWNATAPIILSARFAQFECQRSALRNKE